MKDNKNNVWVGIDDKVGDPEFIASQQSEFTELPIVDSLSKDQSLELSSNRRDFLKYLGFGLGAATLAASCDTPVRRAIPYVTKPDKIVPGVATYYASSFVNGGDYCPILVKTREGRPIKIEGNAMSSMTNGGTNARTQAYVLGLYDTSRFRSPQKMVDGKATAVTWKTLDEDAAKALSTGAKVRIITNTVLSPSTKQVFADFKAKYPNTEVVTYDPVSSSALLQANEQCFGQKMVPAYHFDKADIIVSFDADFLGTWISPVEYANQYIKNRKINTKRPNMSHHVQVESRMSMTGSNADNRILVKPSEQGAAIVALYNAVAAQTGGGSVSGPKVNAKAGAALKKLATSLTKSRGKSLVVCGTNNIGEQLLVNKINDMLGNYGKTLSFSGASMQRQGTDDSMQNLVKEMSGGGVDAVFVLGDANPAFDLPNREAFMAAFAKVKTRISFSNRVNETASMCTHVAPAHHGLESWGDAEPKRGHYSLIQPTIQNMFDTRQVEDTLLLWSGSSSYDAKAEQPYYEYVKNYWKNNIFGRSGFGSFSTFWESALHDGVVEMEIAGESGPCNVDASSAAQKVTQPSSSEFELSFYETLSAGAGQYIDNPWLQEMPDPVSRCTWGNYLSVPVEYDGHNTIEGIKGIGGENKKGKADYVTIATDGEPLKVTAVPGFGQMPNTLSIGLGYGRQIVGKTGMGVGQDVNPMIGFDKNNNIQYFATNVTMSDIVGTDEEFACVQYHDTFGVTALYEPENEVVTVDDRTVGINGYDGAITDRSIIYQSNIRDLKGENGLIKKIEEKRDFAKHLNDQTLYPFDEYSEKVYGQGHHWGMYVDLNACIGCNACTVACMAENNIPVVGKKEVHRHHEMAWLRIDRYYYGDIENPNTVYQPLMCQHCDNAPCENVCPVAATNHSSEGLNQMTYNRCIGTRYCANNCPYKVRRFNWLDYTTADIFPGNQPDVNGEEIPFGADNLTRMVLNPDVTVRSRGVIEKCSFCVQRIQEGKLTAKREGRRLANGDVKTACQTACPTGAIVFGDTNNKESEVSKRIESDLVYRVLEEVNLQSSVYYSAKVNNRDEALDA